MFEKLKGALDYIKGKKPTLVEYSNEDTLPYLSAEYLRNNKLESYVDKKNIDSKYHCNSDDLLIIWDGSNSGEVFMGKPGILSSTMAKLNIKDKKYTNKYLYYFLKQKFSILNKKVTGAAIPHLNRAVLENLEIYSATQSEQQEIVQVLDTMSDIIRLREECISHAQDLIPALFQEMFGDIHNNKTNSQIVKLGDVADFIRGPFGGSLKKEIFVNEGYLVYEQYHAINNDFNFARYFIDEQKYKEMQRFSVKAGDLLISCSGTMGKIAIVPDNYKKGIINQALLKLTVNPEYLNNIFLKNLLLTDYYQKNYFKDQPGAAIQNVRSVKVLKNIDIILPSLSLQKQFVQKAIEIESYIEEQQEELENAKQMFQSLLHHAFTGELTKHKYGEINE